MLDALLYGYCMGQFVCRIDFRFYGCGPFSNCLRLIAASNASIKSLWLCSINSDYYNRTSAGFKNGSQLMPKLNPSLLDGREREGLMGNFRCVVEPVKTFKHLPFDRNTLLEWLISSRDALSLISLLANRIRHKN